MAWDFSEKETQRVFQREVKKRMNDFGMSREQAEMLVAVLMTETTMDELEAEELRYGKLPSP